MQSPRSFCIFAHVLREHPLLSVGISCPVCCKLYANQNNSDITPQTPERQFVSAGPWYLSRITSKSSAFSITNDKKCIHSQRDGASSRPKAECFQGIRQLKVLYHLLIWAVCFMFGGHCILSNTYSPNTVSVCVYLLLYDIIQNMPSILLPLSNLDQDPSVWPQLVFQICTLHSWHGCVQAVLPDSQAERKTLGSDTACTRTM